MENTEQSTKHRHRSHISREEREKKKAAQNIVSAILSFLLTLVLFLAFFLLGVKIGIFNKGMVLDCLNQSNYYENVQATIEDSAESILLPSGLPNTVLKDVVSLDKVYIHAKNYIEGAFDGREIEIDVIDMKAKIRENIEQYMNENAIEMTEEADNGIIELSGAIVDEYTRLLEFPFANYFYKYGNIYEKVFMVAFPALCILAGILIVILIKLHKWKHKAIRFIAFSDMAAALMLIVAPLALLISEFYTKIHISPQYFYQFVVSYLKWDITVFLYIGLSLIGVFILLMPLIYRLKKKKTK